MCFVGDVSGESVKFTAKEPSFPFIRYGHYIRQNLDRQVRQLLAILRELKQLDSLKNLRINKEQESEIEEVNHKIMELTEQSHILSRVAQKGYVDSALFIQKQNALNVELEETKRKRNSLLDSNGFEKEISGTQRLLEIIRYNPVIMEDYDESLFSHTVEQVIIGQKNTITFKLINGLELIEKAGTGGEQE